MKINEKFAFLGLLLVFHTSFLKGQSDLFGNQQIVDNTIPNACFVSTADLDNDGDLDILAAAHEPCKLVWYKNDGCGNFDNENLIVTTSISIWSACTADIDNDGDLDVFSASVSDGKLTWYENDGNGNFGTEQIIYTNIIGTFLVYAADLDKNGYTDIIAISCYYNKIVWCKNKGNKKFEEKHIFHIEEVKHGITCLNISDLDCDSDLDILIGNGKKILWLENNGNGIFSKPKTLLKLAIPCHYFNIANLNNKHKLDIITMNNIKNQKVIIYYENDGSNNFKQGERQNIGTNLGLQNFSINDFNNDNHLDIIASWGNNNAIGYYNFTKNKHLEKHQHLKTSEVHTLFITNGDLDNDGDLDLLSALFLEGKIAWHENLLYNTTATEEQYLSNFISKLFPNPVQNELYIENEINEFFTYEVYNILGEMLKKGNLSHLSSTNTIDVKDLEQGIYLLHLRDKDKLEVLKFMK